MIALWISLSLSALASVQVSARYETEPLTNARVWESAPGHLNPALAAYVVELKVEPGELGWVATLRGWSRPLPGCSKEAAHAELRAVIAVWESQTETNAPLLNTIPLNDPLREVRLARWHSDVADVVKAELARKKIKTQCHPQFPTLVAPSARPPERIIRAPAKVWNGNLSARTSIRLLGREMSGHFLVDFQSRFSAMSPIWLENQGGGIPLSISRLGVRKDLRWAGSSDPVRGAFVPVQRMFISGQDLSVQGLFLIEGLDLYAPPNQLSECCDGLLGQDFLEQSVVEFWPRGVENEGPYLGFYFPTDFGMTADWQSTPLVRTANYQLQLPECGNAMLGLFESYGARKCLGIRLDRFFREVPTVVDFPNGRLWVRKKDALPHPEGDPGVVFRFQMEKGDRVLRIESISPPEKRRWFIAGAAVGSKVRSLGPYSASELDQTEVNSMMWRYPGLEAEVETPKGLAKIRVIRNEKRSRP